MPKPRPSSEYTAGTLPADRHLHVRAPILRASARRSTSRSPAPPRARLEHPPDGGPAQQAGGAEDEPPDDELVLAAVALEARGEHVRLQVRLQVHVLADGQVLRQAEGARALGARRRRRALLVVGVLVFSGVVGVSVTGVLFFSRKEGPRGCQEELR